MRLDARRSPTLSAAIEVMSTMPREAAKATRTYSKTVIGPEWRKGLDQRAHTKPQQERIVAGSAVYISDRGVKLAAGSAKAGSLTKQEEFGADRQHVRTYQRRTRHGSGRVTRHTQRQFRPFRRGGYVAYPTASELIPRIASLWVQTIYRTVAEAIERHIK